MENNKTVGANIAKRRKELGLTQEELAVKLGYKSKSTINKIELGINDITQSKVAAFAKALGTTARSLMGWEEQEFAERDIALQEAFDKRPEMRLLFSAAETATKEDIERTIAILEALKGK